MPVGYPDRHASDESLKIQLPKRYDYNDNDEDNNPHVNNANDDNSSPQKFSGKLLYFTFISFLFINSRVLD